MNDWDKNNLHFLLTCSPAGIKQFFEESDDDDIAYAMELVVAAMEEVLEKNVEFSVQSNNQYTEANTVLQKFRLQK